MFHPYEVLGDGRRIRRVDLPDFKAAEDVRQYLVEKQPGRTSRGFQRLDWVECIDPLCAVCNVKMKAPN